MTTTEINTCLQEILKDENGNTITPSCGIEKLLCLLCENKTEFDNQIGDIASVLDSINRKEV